MTTSGEEGGKHWGRVGTKRDKILRINDVLDRICGMSCNWKKTLSGSFVKIEFSLFSKMEISNIFCCCSFSSFPAFPSSFPPKTKGRGGVVDFPGES